MCIWAVYLGSFQISPIVQVYLIFAPNLRLATLSYSAYYFLISEFELNS